MKSFEYVITNPDGIDANPAYELQKLARNYRSDIVVSCGERTAPVLRLMKMMEMAFKCGERVTVHVNGTDEEAATSAIEAFFKAKF